MGKPQNRTLVVSTTSTGTGTVFSHIVPVPNGGQSPMGRWAEEKQMGIRALISCIMFLVMFLVQPLVAQNLQDGLVAYWSFDGDATDGSGNANDGAENGDTAYVAGRVGDALSLESDGAYLKVENNEDLQLMGPFTVSVHVNLSDTGHGDILYHGLGCSTWASWFLGVQGAEPDATLVPDSYVFGIRTANGGAYLGASGEATAGEWVHVAATYDGANLTLYVDTEEIETVATDPPYASTEPLHVGGDPGCGGRSWYTGLLDEVRIYNRVVSAAELAGLMAGGLAVDPADKLASTWGAIRQSH